MFTGPSYGCFNYRDMSKPINVLTGLDYWLDNLMCNVPELAMCYHLNGIVQVQCVNILLPSGNLQRPQKIRDKPETRTLSFCEIPLNYCFLDKSIKSDVIIILICMLN